MVEIINEKVIFVFVSWKQNHANLSQKLTVQCTAMHCNDTPQLLTPDGSNMTHNDRWILGNYDLGSVANGTVAPCPSYTDRVFLAERGRLHNNHFQNY